MDGGLSNGDGSGGNPGTLFVGPRTVGAPSSLSLSDGNLIFDTGGSWSHSSGLSGKGSITTHDFLANGRRWGYSVCTFSFTDLTLGSGVNVTVRGENSLRLQVDGNVSLSTHINLDGESGKQGIYSGRGGSGGWSSGRGLRNTDLFSNLHPALDGQGPGGGRGYEIGKSTGGGSYGAAGSGGLNGGVSVSFTVIHRFRIWLAVRVEVIRLSAAEMPVVVGVPLVLWWEEASLWRPIHPFPQMVEMG